MEEVLCVTNRIICLLRCYKTRFIIQESCKKGLQNKLFFFVFKNIEKGRNEEGGHNT